MTKAELNRLKYRTISFKDIITGGWALKFQASHVNKYNSYLFFGGPREPKASAIECPLGHIIGHKLDSSTKHGHTNNIDAESCICYDSARKAVVFCGG